MCKKLAIMGAVVIGLVAVLGFTKVGSYSRTAWKEIREGAQNQVPIEWEIKRLKEQVAQLIPDLRKNLSIVAEQMAYVERLEREIQTTKANLATQDAVLVKMAQDLRTQETSFIYAGKVYNREQVGRKFVLDKKAFEIATQELDTKEKMLEIKRRELEAAKAKLDSVRQQEASLKLEIAQLEADFQNVQLAKTKNRFVVDDSTLDDVKKSIEELRFRLEKERNLARLEAEHFGNDTIEGVDRPAPRPIEDIAREFLEQRNGNKVVNER
jgi:peptidoglycan hydrolase CwlO-like protein